MGKAGGLFPWKMPRACCEILHPLNGEETRHKNPRSSTLAPK